MGWSWAVGVIVLPPRRRWGGGADRGWSGRPDGAAVDGVFGAGDGRGSVAHEEGDEFGDLFRLGGTAEGDAAEGVHQLPEGVLPGAVAGLGDPVHEGLGGGRPDEA